MGTLSEDGTGSRKLTTLEVRSAIAGAVESEVFSTTLRVSIPSASLPLRDLVDAVVRAEVEAFRRRAAEQRSVRVLTASSFTEGLIAGAVRSGGKEVPSDINSDDAVRTALQAQRDGLYHIIVDGQPIDDLETVVRVPDGTRIMFLRLVALTGG